MKDFPECSKVIYNSNAIYIKDAVSFRITSLGENSVTYLLTLDLDYDYGDGDSLPITEVVIEDVAAYQESFHAQQIKHRKREEQERFLREHCYFSEDIAPIMDMLVRPLIEAIPAETMGQLERSYKYGGDHTLFWLGELLIGEDLARDEELCDFFCDDLIYSEDESYMPQGVSPLDLWKRGFDQALNTLMEARLDHEQAVYGENHSVEPSRKKLLEEYAPLKESMTPERWNLLGETLSKTDDLDRFRNYIIDLNKED